MFRLFICKGQKFYRKKNPEVNRDYCGTNQMVELQDDGNEK